MKKLFLLILPVLALSFNACDKDDDGVSEENLFTINGKTVNLVYGEITQDSDTEVVLYLCSEDEEAGMECLIKIPSGSTKLPAGTYTYDHLSDDPFKIYSGAVGVDDNEFSISGGTIKVSVSGSTYTIVVDCTLNNGGTIKGTYIGSLIWYDERD